MAVTVDKYRVVAAMVRSFFGAFASGVVDCHPGDWKDNWRPPVVKKLMLEHYEHIAPAFFDVMFYPLATMNFGYDDIVRLVGEAEQRGDDMMALVRMACGDDGLYEAMVTEYKRNFGCLLAGRCEDVAACLESYTRSADNEACADNDMAIQLVVRVAMRGYAAGLRRADKGQLGHFRQATLFRLMLDAMDVLLGDGQTCLDDCDDLGDMFMRVCRDEHNFKVMTDEMDRIHEELMAE